MSNRTSLFALPVLAALLVAGLGLAGGASTRSSAPILDWTYTGEGFLLPYPSRYRVRPFVGGLALVERGRGDVLTASVLERPANARGLTNEAYARRFGPLNIQGAGALVRLVRLELPGGTPAWAGTWRGSRGGVIGPLYLVPLEGGGRRWLILEAEVAAELPLLDVVARNLRIRR